MSVTSLTTHSTLETALLQALKAETTKAASPSTASTLVTPADAAAVNTTPVSTLTKDLTALLHSLVNGNVDSAQSDLKKLSSDLQSQSASRTSTQSSADTATSSTTAVTSNPLTALVSTLSQSLSSGSTTGALQDLASYLVTTGLGTGSLINTTA